MPYDVWTLDQIVDNLDRDQWNWDERTINYTFFDTLPANYQGEGSDEYAGFSAFVAWQETAVAQIFALIREVTGLRFVEVPDNGATTGKITFASSSDLPDYVWGWAELAGQWSGSEARGDITRGNVWLNTDYASGSFSLGTFNFMSLMHEILHALGVNHPGDYNADGGDITYYDDAEYVQDSNQYTVMSYFDARDTGAAHYFERMYYASTLLLHDIAVLQSMYGVNTSTRSGDTTYGFNSNAGGQYAFTAETRAVMTIWDAGGNDTIDFSGFIFSSWIDLKQGAFSNFMGLTQNFSIAYGAVIENATTGSNNDILVGNEVINVLTGGGGDDEYYVQNTGDVVVETATGGNDVVYSTASFALTDASFVEKLILENEAGDINATGSNRNDILVGNDGANILTGGKGDDTYYVYGGDTVVELKGEGKDTVYAYGVFTLQPGSYVEILILEGNYYGPSIGTGNGLNNLMYGSYMADTLDGGKGADKLYGGGGDDTYIIDAEDEVFESAWGGMDTIVASFSYSLVGRDTLEGIQLTGSANLMATGNDLNNTLTGNAGINVLTGGKGNDTYVVQNAEDVIVELKNGGGDRVYSSVDFVLKPGSYVEALFLTGEGGLRGTGNGLDNTIHGWTGNDILDGGKGADTMSGGLGNDTYYVDNVGDRVFETNGHGKDHVYASVDFSLEHQFLEYLTLTGDADIYATGNGLNNILTGNAGINRLAGGKGNDTYYVQNTFDMIREAKDEGADIVYSSVSFVLKAGVYVEALTLTGTADLDATGNGIANLITGNAGRNAIDGGAGNDTLRGGSGDDILNGGVSGSDTLYGGLGNDVFHVNSSKDEAYEAKGEGTDWVYSSVDYSLKGQYIEYLTLTGSGDIYAKGNTLDNRLVGNSGDNRINGMEGQDRLTGGGGGDTFIWDATSHSKVNDSDRIVDLTNEDFIDLSRIDANATVAGTQHFTLVDAFTNTAGQVMLSYDASTKVTSLTADTNGDGVADMLVRIDGNHEDFDNFIFGG